MKIERSLPKLPNEATPEQIDRTSARSKSSCAKARATAKQGDIFTPEARPVIKRLLATVFGGPEAAAEGVDHGREPGRPGRAEAHVNGRYPDTVPLTTIPPQVLQTLPKLTEDLEYRFIGDWLILLDTHAHVIADFIDNALPK